MSKVAITIWSFRATHAERLPDNKQKLIVPARTMFLKNRQKTRGWLFCMLQPGFPRRSSFKPPPDACQMVGPSPALA